MTNIEKLAARLPENCDAAVITDPDDRFWLTGFASSAGMAAVTRKESLFLTDFRYTEAARQQISGARVLQTSDYFKDLSGFFEQAEVKTVCFRDDRVTVRQAKQCEEKLGGFRVLFDRALSELLDRIAEVKEPGELERIRRAQQITDAAFAKVLPTLKTGMRECDVALALEYEMRKLGAGSMAFETIAVSGENSSKPHGVPGERRIREGEFLTMDFGAKYDGYCSDMTRTVCFGEPSEEMKKVYDTVLEAQLSAIDAICAGKVCSEIDAIARGIINRAGYEGCFGHGLGHSLGVRIHESPRLSPSCGDVLAENVMMTVEPGIYLEGKFGVRIEDLVIVGKNGCEILTKSPKQLICI